MENNNPGQDRPVFTQNSMKQRKEAAEPAFTQNSMKQREEAAEPAFTQNSMKQREETAEPAFTQNSMKQREPVSEPEPEAPKSPSKRPKKWLWIAIGAAVLCAAAAIVLVLVLKKPAAKQDENKQADVIAASADGEEITLSEYQVTYLPTSRYYAQLYAAYGIMLDESAERDLRESAAQEALLQKIYIKEGKALGLSLTKEEQDACEKQAQDYIDSIRSAYRDMMTENGEYSEEALARKLDEYYRNFGMSEDAYREWIRTSSEAMYYAEKLRAYYAAQDAPDEEELLRYYRERAEGSMYIQYEDGTTALDYRDGIFWEMMTYYMHGYAMPMLYVPEDYIFIDYVRIEVDTPEEAEEIVRSVDAGGMSFDELQASERNTDPYRNVANGPYPIAEYDHWELFNEQEIYEIASRTEVGEIASYVEDQENGTGLTVHLFRRAEGDIFMDGSRVIDIDWYTGMRETMQDAYLEDRFAAREDAWLSDIRYEDVIYTAGDDFSDAVSFCQDESGSPGEPDSLDLTDDSMQAYPEIITTLP